MTFNEVMPELLNGRKIKRVGKLYADGAPIEVSIYYKKSDEKLYNVYNEEITLSGADLIATDWEVLKSVQLSFEEREALKVLERINNRKIFSVEKKFGLIEIDFKGCTNVIYWNGLNNENSFYAKLEFDKEYTREELGLLYDD